MGYRYGERKYSEGLYSRWPDHWHDKVCDQDKWAAQKCERPTWIPSSGAPYVAHFDKGWAPLTGADRNGARYGRR